MKRKTVFLICGSAELHVSLDLFALWGLALVHLQHIKRGFFFFIGYRSSGSVKHCVSFITRYSFSEGNYT